MSIIEKLANDVASDMVKTDKLKISVTDPFVISVIIDVITELVKIYERCQKTPEDTVESMKNPGLIERWRLRRVIRKHVDDDEAHNHLGRNLFKSTLHVAKNLNQSDVEEMFEEVK